MRLAILLLLGTLGWAVDGWTMVGAAAATPETAPALVRDWYRFAWSGVRAPSTTHWTAARVSGDLVLRGDGGDSLLLREDGMVEARPLSAEEAPSAPAAEDLARCERAIAALALLAVDPPLVPDALSTEIEGDGTFTLSWESERDRGHSVSIAPGSSNAGVGFWGRCGCRAACRGAARTPPSGKG